MRKIIILAILIFLPFSHIPAQDRVTGHNFASRSEVIAQNGMAATSHPLATQIALDILKQGGSAVDAAIAANAALGLMEPTGCGIGGDLFAIIWDSESGKLHGLNASGRSPGNLNREYFIENDYEFIPSSGALSVSVPGTVDGWFEMHSRFGVLDMKTILKPSIDYGNDGFPVTELIAYYLEKSVGRLGHFPNFRETYMPDGKMPAKGEIFRNPGLANTYDILARGGRDAFYKGEIARTIGDYIAENGGFLRYEDMAAHKSEWVDPVSANYRGYDIWQLPPNGQGIAVLQMLNILEYYDIASMGPNSPEYLHLLTEAKKLAFEDRARYYADMDFSPLPVEKLISRDYANERRKLIDPERAARRYDPGMPEQPSTIYLTVADRKGNMVSLIQSNYRGMGSGMTPPGLGFVLQNRGEGFTLKPGHFNTYEPGKRPFHTIIPGFVTKDGYPLMSFGVMGGDMQPQGHVQVVINLIDFGMNLQEAGDAPRIYHTGSSEPTGQRMTDGGTLMIESGFPYETIRELMEKGHRVQWALGPFGGYQAILWDRINKVYYGASESRKDGQAAGY
jgi:gamma-glutamyltranspeptidase / glutathione hydrolase